MKRIYLFIGGGIIILGLVGFWLYSFLYGSPTNGGNLFTNLGNLGGGGDTTVVETVPAVPTVDVATDKLRQLTTRPVIGMRTVATAGSSTIMRYVEAGTGHIYDIDLASGAESRVSPVSVPVASEAAISRDGEYVAIRSGYNNQNELVIITLAGTEPSSTVLPHQVESFTWSDNSTLLFTEFDNGATEGKRYHPETKAVSREFRFPATSLEVVWGEGTSTPHYLYTKPASLLTGYAYRTTSTGFTRLPVSGLGLSLNRAGAHLLIGKNSPSYQNTFLYSNNNEAQASITTAPEKCVGARGGTSIYCAAPLEGVPENFPESWYKGITQFNDRIWLVHFDGSSEQLIDPAAVTGRSLDIIKPMLDETLMMLYFINKTDKTLWVYDLT